MNLKLSGMLMGLIPLDLVYGGGIEAGWRVDQARTMLDSWWVLLVALVVTLLLGALAVFLLWANDVPIPTLDALRRAPTLVSPPLSEEHPKVHLPNPSYWPIVLAFTLTILGTGLITNWIVAVIGGLASIGAIIAWGIEPGE